MRLITLVRNEWIKTTRRFAFWVGFLTFGGFATLIFGELWHDARRRPNLEYAFPGAWTEITDEKTLLTVVFATVIVAMLVGSEYANRTARQNVIDGLSKEQFFGAKVIQWLGVAAAFALMQILVGAAFAAVGTPPATDWLRTTDLSLLGGFGTAVLIMTALGFVLTVATRNAAAGIGLFFLYIAFVEDVAVAAVRLVHEGAARAMAPYLPSNLSGQLLQSWQWDPASLLRTTVRAVESGGTPPVPMDPTVLVGAALAWTVALVVGAFILFRARDL